MRTLSRVTSSLLGILLLVAALIPVLLVRPLDSSRMPVETALVEARENIRDARIPLETGQSAPLRAGWATRDITPIHALPLAGYGARRGADSEGVSSPLTCRVLALQAGDQAVVLVSLDLLLIPEPFGRDLQAAFSEQTGWPPESLFLAPSHTHSAPDPWDNRVVSIVTGGGYRPDYGLLLRQAVLDAAQEALDRLEPAELAMGRDWAPEFVRNRVREAPIDAWLEWIAVRQVGREPLCLVVNYAAHGTVLSASHRRADADYPGALVVALESLEAVDLALFQAGALGSASPRVPPVSDSTPRQDRPAVLGQALAGRVGALRGDLPWTNNVLLGAGLARIPLPPFQFRLGIRDWVLARWVSRRLGFGDRAPLHMVRIGTGILLGLPVELSAEISLDLKEAFRTAHGIDLWVVSMSTGFYGYLTPDELYGKKDGRRRAYYEASTMAFLGPHAEFFFRAVLAKAAGAH